MVLAASCSGSTVNLPDLRALFIQAADYKTTPVQNKIVRQPESHNYAIAAGIDHPDRQFEF